MPRMREIDLFWQSQLLAFGFRCEDGKRRNKIARIIAKNGFRDPAKLRFAPHVEKWIGTENIRLSEVEELKRFCISMGDVCKKRAEPGTYTPRDVCARTPSAEIIPFVENCAALAPIGAADQAIALPAAVASAGGPRKVLKTLQAALGDEQAREQWMQAARVAAIVGSAPRSVDKLACGLRLWFDFHGTLAGTGWGPALPPSVAALLAWSCTFRCQGTWVHYLGHVKTGAPSSLNVRL